jgi:hypothetical protein
MNGTKRNFKTDINEIYTKKKMNTPIPKTKKNQKLKYEYAGTINV